ncbi:MAG: N-acetylneuraminate synthase family protein [Planctomycetota bacterium]|jgi:sialic acid synthase SpsE
MEHYEDLPEIIAEIGINHQGSVDVAKQTIDMVVSAARNTGYPLEKVLIKFQKRMPEHSVPKEMWETRRVSPVTGREMSYIEYKNEIEFWQMDYEEVDAHTRKHGVWWFSSVFDLPSADFFYQYFSHIPYLKIPSAHLTNHKLIQHIVDYGHFDIIMSTGMSDYEEIDEAVDLIPYALTVLACTGTYPSKDSEARLNNIKTLDYLYGNGRIKVGYSSHNASPYPAIYSNFFDVDMIEVHVTLDRAMPGSDHGASLEKPAIELLMRETLRIPLLYGTGKLEVLPSEMDKRMQLRGY